MNKILFPQHEFPAIKGRLQQGKTFFTTRVSDELGKYKKGDKLKAPWGDTLEVVSVERVHGLDNHKFKGELTQVEKNLLSHYKEMDHVQLRRL